MSENIAAQGDKLPILVLPGIRDCDPTTQLVWCDNSVEHKSDLYKGILDPSSSIKTGAIKYLLPCSSSKNGPDVVNIKWGMAENRYEGGYVDEYKTWLQNNLRDVVNLTQRVGKEIEDV